MQIKIKKQQNVHVHHNFEKQHIHEHSELILSEGLDVGQMGGGHRQVVRLKRSAGTKENTRWYTHKT